MVCATFLLPEPLNLKVADPLPGRQVATRGARHARHPGRGARRGQDDAGANGSQEKSAPETSHVTAIAMNLSSLGKPPDL